MGISQKIDVLAIGKGHIRDNASTSIVFNSNLKVDYWSMSPTYLEGNVVEDSGYLFRALATNTNSAPTLVNTDWEVLLIAPKDGDIALVVNGASSTMQQRQAGQWVAAFDVPVEISLVDGQLTPVAAITFLGSSFYYAKLEYTIRRGALHGRKRAGEMIILNDGTAGIDYNDEWVDTGVDVNVTLTPVMNAGNVEVQYTSAAEGILLSMKYILKGWS